MHVSMVKIFVRVVQVPPAILPPGVPMVCFVDIFLLSGSYFDLLLMMLIVILGYVLGKFDTQMVPVILGILLGANMEDALRRCSCADS